MKNKPETATDNRTLRISFEIIINAYSKKERSVYVIDERRVYIRAGKIKNTDGNEYAKLYLHSTSEASNLRVKAEIRERKRAPQKQRFRVSRMQILNFSLYANDDYITFAFLILTELHLPFLRDNTDFLSAI